MTINVGDDKYIRLEAPISRVLLILNPLITLNPHDYLSFIFLLLELEPEPDYLKPGYIIKN